MVGLGQNRLISLSLHHVVVNFEPPDKMLGLYGSSAMSLWPGPEQTGEVCSRMAPDAVARPSKSFSDASPRRSGTPALQPFTGGICTLMAFPY
jgi:hypothetical protein